MKITYILTLLSLNAVLFANSQNSQDDWFTHVSENKKGILMTTVNLRYIEAKPNYKNVLIVGTYSQKCFTNGYLKPQGLEKIYSFSDSIADIVNQHSKNRLVGIITYQCTGFDIYYVKDTIHLRNSIQNYIDKNYKNSKNYLVLNRDKKWIYYKENLLPKDWSDAFFTNQELLSQLVSEGDHLAVARKVSHWINFKKEKKRQRFINKIKEFNFTIDSLTIKKEAKRPYTLKISRKDNIIPDEISKLTALVKLIAISSSGIYDGWGTKPVLKN